MLITRGLGIGGTSGNVPTEKVYVPIYDPTMDVVSLGNNTIYSSVSKPSISIDITNLIPITQPKSRNIITNIDITNLKPTIIVKKDNTL